MVSVRERRQAYERDVLALTVVAGELSSAGLTEEAVARRLVSERNRLKAEFRRLDPVEDVRMMESRNRRKYGDPLGPGPDQLLLKYGSWKLVIEAACRPAHLSNGNPHAKLSTRRR